MMCGNVPAVWTWGMRNGKLTTDRNPFTGISPPKAKRKGREPRAGDPPTPKR